MFDPPFLYPELNAADSKVSPAFVHIRNTQTAKFFKRYLMHEVFSVFRFQLPSTWDEDYFRFTLFNRGYLVVFDTADFGVIPQECTLAGKNVFRRPTTPRVANPLLPNIPELTIGVNCELIRLTPDYSGLSDIVDYYGNLMALCYSTASTNILNSSLSFVFPSANKAESDTWKAMFDEIAKGQPAVFPRKPPTTLGASTDMDSWHPFQADVGRNFIAGQIMDVLHTIRDAFLSEIGIPAMSTRKKERVSVDETHRNDIETICKATIWLDEIQASMQRVSAMFAEAAPLSAALRFDKEVITDGRPSVD